jgi:uncharacterized protein
MKQYLLTHAALSFAVCSYGVTAQAASFDCRQATRVQEKFICQHDEISKLDEELARAYRAQTKTLSSEAQSAVLASQRSWLAYWPWACSASPTTVKLQADAMGCVSDLYRARLKEFNVLALAVGRASYTVSEYRFLAPKASDEPAATHTISFPQVAINSSEDVSLNLWLARDLNKWRTGLDNDSDSELTVTLNAVTPSLIQTTETVTFYGHGAAHPQNNMVRHYFLTGAGRTLQTSDFFASKQWIEIVANHVFVKLQKRFGEYLQIKREQDLYPLISHPSSWSIKKDSFSLEFNPYEVAPYAEGFVDVEVPLALLRPHLTPFAREWMTPSAR